MQREWARMAEAQLGKANTISSLATVTTARESAASQGGCSQGGCIMMLQGAESSEGGGRGLPFAVAPSIDDSTVV